MTPDLAHPVGRDGAEGTDEVGLDTGRRLKGEDTRGSQQVHWHLVGGQAAQAIINTHTTATAAAAG